MDQPRQKDHPAYRKSKGSGATESEEDGQRHLRLSLDASGAGCRDYKSGMRQSPGSARRGRDGTSTQPQGTASIKSRKAQTYIPVRDKLRSQPGRKDHQAYRNSKGSKQPKARKTGPTPHCVYRWMLQELLHWQPVRHVNRVLEVRGGDGTSTQPQGTTSAHCRKAQTHDPVRDKVRSQPGRKTTKRTAIPRGHSNRKRGRQRHRHTMSIAGCIRIRLSRL